MKDNVNHPSHYETGKFECIEVMLETQGKEAVKNFCICNAFKYIYRHNNKNGVEDIKKAKWYLDKYIEIEESEECKDRPAEDQKANREREIDEIKKVLNEKFGRAVYADNETGYDKGIDLKSHKKRIVSFEVVNKCSANITHLKEMYGISMRNRNITITYWPNFDIYLMTALVSRNDIEHQIVKGDVDYETLAFNLLQFFSHIDVKYSDDEEENKDGDTQDSL